MACGTMRDSALFDGRAFREKAWRIVNGDIREYDAIGTRNHVVARKGANLAREQIDPDGILKRRPRPVQDGGARLQAVAGTAVRDAPCAVGTYPFPRRPENEQRGAAPLELPELE